MQFAKDNDDIGFVYYPTSRFLYRKSRTTMELAGTEPLDLLLEHFSLKAGVFYAGTLCGRHDFPLGENHGHLHLIRSGQVVLFAQEAGSETLSVDSPTLLFLPRPQQHRLVASDDPGAEVICGTVQFGDAGVNPVTHSLPAVVRVALHALPAADLCLRMMLGEASGEMKGKQAVLDRLCEILTIHLLRYCIETEMPAGGALAGLADRRLSKALKTIHQNPSAPLQLDMLADLAGMSRARFAVRFKEVVGETPADYVSTWRLMLCQKLLRKGPPLKQIAAAVGYGSASAMTRAFVRKFGCSPSAWQKQH